MPHSTALSQRHTSQPNIRVLLQCDTSQYSRTVNATHHSTLARSRSSVSVTCVEHVLIIIYACTASATHHSTLARSRSSVSVTCVEHVLIIIYACTANATHHSTLARRPSPLLYVHSVCRTCSHLSVHLQCTRCSILRRSCARITGWPRLIGSLIFIGHFSAKVTCI